MKIATSSQRITTKTVHKHDLLKKENIARFDVRTGPKHILFMTQTILMQIQVTALLCPVILRKEHKSFNDISYWCCAIV